MLQPKSKSRAKALMASILVLLWLVSWPPVTQAWARKEHVFITRVAVKLLLDQASTPPALQALLREGLGNTDKIADLEKFVLEVEETLRLDAGLDLYSFRPDELVGLHSLVPGFDSTEEKMHYLDTDEFNPQRSRQVFAADGSNKVLARSLPRNPRDPRYKSAGFVTFRAEQCYKSLIASLKTNYSNEQVFLWLGYLSHYISDSYQPYHSTIDYQGFNCACNVAREPKHRFHGDMEGLLFRDTRAGAEALRLQFWQYFQAALNRDIYGASKKRLDPYLVSQSALLSGYDYLPMLCRAGEVALAQGEFDADAWFNYSEMVGKHKLTLLELKAARMAEASLVLNRLILQAWQEAQQKKGKGKQR